LGPLGGPPVGTGGVIAPCARHCLVALTAAAVQIPCLLLVCFSTISLSTWIPFLRASAFNSPRDFVLEVSPVLGIIFPRPLCFFYLEKPHSLRAPTQWCHTPLVESLTYPVRVHTVAQKGGSSKKAAPAFKMLNYAPGRLYSYKGPILFMDHSGAIGIPEIFACPGIRPI